MKRAFKTLTTSLTSAFVLAGCATVPSTEKLEATTDTMQLAVLSADLNDLDFVAGCKEGDRGALLTYSIENRDYTLTLVDGDKSRSEHASDTQKNILQKLEARLAKHCSPRV